MNMVCDMNEKDSWKWYGKKQGYRPTDHWFEEINIAVSKVAFMYKSVLQNSNSWQKSYLSGTFLNLEYRRNEGDLIL